MAMYCIVEQSFMAYNHIMLTDATVVIVNIAFVTCIKAWLSFENLIISQICYF